MRKAGNDKLILLQCVTNYPSPVADANLKAMVAIGDEFKVPVGYSDHTIGQGRRRGRSARRADGILWAR